MIEKINKLCKENGISISQLERELGFGKGTISKWKSSSPSLDKAIAIADYFNVDMDYLIGREVAK
ncbi:MAG: helix-turn-helix transcriptional regulator [Clostridiales bacterium]|nr:helix-turn-helix transcriptional regulator [Clostridiales bacterium]